MVLLALDIAEFPLTLFMQERQQHFVTVHIIGGQKVATLRHLTAWGHKHLLQHKQPLFTWKSPFNKGQATPVRVRMSMSVNLCPCTKRKVSCPFQHGHGRQKYHNDVIFSKIQWIFWPNKYGRVGGPTPKNFYFYFPCYLSRFFNLVT